MVVDNPTTSVFSERKRATIASKAKLFKGVKVKPPAKQAKTTHVTLGQVPPSSPGQVTPTLPGEVKPKKVKRVKNVKPSKQVNAKNGKNGKAPNGRRLQEWMGLDVTVPIEQIYLLAT